LEKGLKPYKLTKIVGGQSDGVRGLEIEKFKYTQDTPILLASVRSGGEGLNLAEASYVVHFDHWWNPAVMWQAEDRAHRPGQKNSVNIYSYWMMDTIDERIREILDRKGLLIENVVDGLAEKDIDELFTMDDLFEIMDLKRAATSKPKFESQAWRNLSLEQIRKKLFEIKPYEFEDLVQQLMHYLGFPNVKVTKRSGDGGIDIISSRNTTKGVERIAAQCKRYKGTVGVRIAREFVGAIRDDPSIVKGYLITTGDFTQDCIRFCIRNGIEMIPGIKVTEYVKMFSLEA
jgi:HJR/Mrr/RecB family endonuclease